MKLILVSNCGGEKAVVSGLNVDIQCFAAGDGS
jgi:hypothetical protein